MLRALALAPEFLSIGGGASTYIMEMARMSPRNLELHIVIPSAPPETMNEIIHMLPGNVVIHALNGPQTAPCRDLVFSAINAVKLARLVKETGSDVVISSSRMPDIFCRPSSIPVPIITTVHSTIQSHLDTIRLINDDREFFDRHERMILAAGGLAVSVENRYYRSNRHFISVSKWGKNNLESEKRVDPKRISLIYNGVDTDMFNPALRERTNEMFPALDGGSGLNALYIGRFTSGKGFRILIKAIRNNRSLHRVHFILAGNMTEKLRNDIPENCTVLGHVPHSITPYLYASADLLILPSLYENMPLSLLEAMATGCVPIAANVGGVPEVVENRVNGMLVERGDPEALLKALEELVDDENGRTSMRLAGRKLIEERHSLTGMIEKTASVMERVSVEGAVLRGDSARQ